MVRDRNEELLRGRMSGTWRISPDPVSSLIAKLGEEYGELAASRDPAELYDMLDVIGELAHLLDPQWEARWHHTLNKARRFGRFSRHLEWHPFPGGEDEIENKQEDGLPGARQDENQVPGRV